MALEADGLVVVVGTAASLGGILWLALLRHLIAADGRGRPLDDVLARHADGAIVPVKLPAADNAWVAGGCADDGAQRPVGELYGGHAGVLHGNVAHQVLGARKDGVHLQA